MNKNTLKNFWAVLVGFLTVVILSVAMDTILEQAGIFPPLGSGIRMMTWMLALALLYRSLFTIFGGYVTAKLTPQNPKRQVMILGIIGTIAGIAGVVMGWGLGDHWYPIAIALTGYLFTWMGGKLYMDKVARKTASVGSSTSVSMSAPTTSATPPTL